jgi:hypothetical protein
MPETSERARWMDGSNSPPVLKEDKREGADDDGWVGEYLRSADDGVPWLRMDHARDLSNTLFPPPLVS